MGYFCLTAASTVYPILNRWNWGDASDSVNTGANTITHTYYSPGIYQVRLIVENTNNERDTVLKTYWYWKCRLTI
ncbi:MAG: PKD domain-containing protein [Chitinophagaceae bacterium]|nr:PKD domain-containing protein [Chitinophagaceae bacterium]